MDADPWLWSADQVAQFFSTEAAGIIEDKPNSQLPDLASLAQKLHDEGVAGADLLTQVDSNFLKEDCGIRQLGKRSSVIYCISRLRVLSDGYQTKDSAPGIQTPRSLNVAPPQPPSLLQQPLPTASVLESPGQHVRSGEAAVHDRNGRKRRKLDLSRPVEKPRADGFLADSGMPVDSLFYGKTQLSREIGDLEPSGVIEHSHVESDSGLEVFQVMPSGHPAGDVQYVYRQVKHLFMNDASKTIRRRGRDAVAILPYREHLLPKGKAVSATVFVPHDDVEDGAIAVRENAAFLDEEVDYYNGFEAQHTDGTWDYLTKNWKSNPEDELLPKYGQSDDEDNEMPSDLEHEVDEEEAERQHEAADKPGKEDMERIMEEFIEALVQTWKEKKLPRLEDKQAWTIWKKMRGSKAVRDGLIAGARQQVRGFDERLKKQKRWIMDETWTNADKLREQCQIMEATVEDREHLLWKIEVWHRKQEPFHVVRHGNHSTSDHAKQLTAHGSGFVLQPGDRLSVEPAEIREEEVFNPPEGSQTGKQDDHGGQADEEEDAAGDDMDLDLPNDNFIVHESSPDAISDGPNNSDVSIPPSIRKHNGSRGPSSTPRRSQEQTMHENSDSDSDLLPELPKMPKSSSQRAKLDFLRTPTKRLAFSNSQNNPVVLSSDSETPLSKSVGKKKGAARKPIFSSDPLSDKKADVDSWDISLLVTQGDRKRLLIKLLAGLGPAKRKLILTTISRLRMPNFRPALRAALKFLRQDLSFTGSDEQTRVCSLCGRLWIASWLLMPSVVAGVTERPIPWTKFEDDPITLLTFTNLLVQVVRKNDSDLFNPPKSKPQSKTSSSILGSSPKSVIDLRSDEELSEDEYQRLLKDTPRKKRKRKVKESESAVQSQHNAAKRMERYRKTQTSDSQQLVAMVQRDPTNSKISINPAKNEDEESIFVHQPIAQVMKGHQIDGVRFMWREITADDGDGTEPQGCLLTHTMGLGKTMQTIAVLVAVNEAAQSESLKVFTQLPPQLRLDAERERQLRMMVLCPPTLIENWRKEIKKWAGTALPNVFCIESGSNKNHLDDMRTWYRIGGVLIIGYELFRNKVHRKESKNAKTNLANNHNGEEIDECLLRGPELVVADEVHNLRNKNARSLAVEGIETQSRIGLSGTPLSNNVDEVYALISFVSPGYLGETKEFKAHYAEPIQNGLYDDSSAYEKRKSLMKLRVLHERIEPKVNRADINSLRGFIPPKTEFVLTLPLTSIQQTAYGRFVSAVLGDRKNEKASQVQIFSWLDILGLLTTHPLAFKKKLLKPVVKKARGRATTPPASTVSDNGGVEIDETADLADQAVLNLGFSQETVNEIIDGIADELEVQNSAKMTMLLNILQLSAICNDKVLVFSGSLGTLDTVQQILADRGMECGRIDGKVPPPKRLQLIAEFDKSSTMNVLLCSTRASGVGLNIQGANRVVILDFGFNPTHEEQAVGRAYRLGQQRPVFVYRMVMGSTFEEHIYNKQLFKQSLFQRVVDRKNPRRVAKKNTREFLFEPQHVCQKDISKWLGKDAKVLDLVLKRELKTAENAGAGDTLIRDLTTYETLQEDAGDEQFTEQEKREIQEEIEAGKRGVFFRPANSASQAGPAPSSTAPASGVHAKNVRVSNILPKQNSRRSVLGGKPGRPPSADKNGIMAPPGSARPAAPVPMPHGLPTGYSPPATMPNQRQLRSPGQN